MRAARLRDTARRSARGAAEAAPVPESRPRLRETPERATGLRALPRGPDWAAVALGVGTAIARLARPE